MARFGDLDTQYFDDAGDPLVNGKIYFYESGTTTLKGTFADINQSIPNTNPVILTAAGRQPNIFFDGVAKAVLTTSSGTQILVRDPVGATSTDFGDEWVATKVYNANDVVIGSDGVYYRSLVNGNQNNNPVTSTGSWSLLYSVEWNAGITYQEGAVVTYDGEQYQSLANSNLNNNPSTSPASWTLLSFAWISTATYDTGMNAVGTDGVLYTSLQDSNTGNDPATSPAYWVGTSAAAAASATAAANSATAAAASETAAAASETAAAASETAAAASETAAAASESAAATSETNAANSATAAATSETNAAASETAAAASASAASTSETNAAASASAASTSETNAAASETAAAASETAAAASESAAATSETNAANSASAASTSASNASTSETNAAGSATAAASSATAAAGSATAAAGSATDAADKYDEFDDRYLGEKASDPTLDNDGNALITGALYFNTSTDAMKVYTGSVWQDIAPVATSVTVSQISDYTGTATELNYTDGVTSSIQTQLDAKAVYPDQTGNAGKFLTTDGTDSSWDIALPDETGNAGKFLTTDGTDASWVDLSASPTLEATSSGTLANGDTVIINADGTVSSVEGNTASISSAVYALTGTNYYQGMAYDTDTGAFVVVGMLSAGNTNPKYNIGTISGDTITFGTEGTISGTNFNYTKVVYNRQFSKMIAFGGWEYNGNYSFGTVDAINRTVSWSATGSLNGVGNYNTLAIDSDSGRMLLVAARSQGYYAAVYYTTNGTTLSRSSVSQVSSTNPSSATPRTIYIGSGRFLTSAPESSNGLKSFITTVTGNTSFSFGSFQFVASGNISRADVAYSPDSNKALIVYEDPNNSNYTSYRLGTVNGGSSVSWGTTVVVSSSRVDSLVVCVYEPNSQKFIIRANDRYFYEGVYFSGSTLSLTQTVGPVNSPEAGSINEAPPMLVNENDNNVIFFAEDRGAIYTPENKNLTESNYIGISNDNYNNGDTAKVQIVGSVDDAQSGLTAGEKYYVQLDGSLGTTPANPSVIAGTAVSATKLIVKG